MRVFVLIEEMDGCKGNPGVHLFSSKEQADAAAAALREENRDNEGWVMSDHEIELPSR